MIIGAVAAYNNVNNFTQQQAVVAAPPASAAFQLRNSAIAETQTRQAVKVSDGSNRSEVTKDKKNVRPDSHAPAGAPRRNANRSAYLGSELDVEV